MAGGYPKLGKGLLDLLNVDVVKDEILSYLNFQDLKCFSEVSKDALSVVRSSKRYRREATLVIGPDAVKTSVESVKEAASTWMGKKVKIDVAIPIELLRSRPLETLLMNVESVALHLSNKSRAYNAVGSFFKEVLEKAKNLKHLELDPVILVKSGQVLNTASIGASYEWTAGEEMFYHRDLYAHSDFLKDNFPSNLKNLESLQIMGGSKLNWPSPRFFKLETPTFAQLNKLVSTLGNLKKLSSHYNCGGARAFHPNHADFTSDYAEGLLKIIKKNRGTLEELEIGDIDIVRLTDIGNMAIPNLKKLAILDSKVPYVRILEAFLAKQPQLDYLNISVVNKLPFRIFKVIEEKQTKLTDV